MLLDAASVVVVCGLWVCWCFGLLGWCHDYDWCCWALTVGWFCCVVWVELYVMVFGGLLGDVKWVVVAGVLVIVAVYRWFFRMGGLFYVVFVVLCCGLTFVVLVGCFR